MNNLPVLDIIIVIIYLVGITLLGIYFGWKRKDSNTFMIAGGSLPGWVVGLSIFGTYLSSNTFLGIPGKAFSEDWNSFVFSLSIPVAAWIAVRYLVPYYRKSGEISAYHHFENRFGKWAKIYAVLCFMLTQLARIGSILFGMGLVLSALLHMDMWIVILVTGILVMIYTASGGIEAVIWTDVVQSILLSLGAVLILFLLIVKTPGGIGEILASGYNNHKFSLGSWHFSFSRSTVWVVFLYGIFINLTNFGIDQNYVQRYHAAKSQKEAAGSVWILARTYIPVSLLFFLIGTSLFVYSIHDRGFLDILQQNTGSLPANISSFTKPEIIHSLEISGAGDKVLPFFIAGKVPSGFSGLIIAALLAAAMSTISSSLNSTATIYLKDLHPTNGDNENKNKNELVILKTATMIAGIVSVAVAIGMIGVKSILDAWWILSGIFSGGLLGLFLLGWLTKVKNTEALLSVITGILVIIWMTVPDLLPDDLSWLKSPFHANMIIVIGTLSIFITGLILSRLLKHD